VRNPFQGRPDVFLHGGRPLGGDVRWAAYPWPDPHEFDEGRILAALRAVMKPAQQDWGDAGTLVRFAVGNDHRGTIYPASVAMVDVLLLIAQEYPGRPRHVALSVLDDWWGGYEPERGFESFVGTDGARIAVIPAIVRRLTGTTALFDHIAVDVSDPVAATLARDLLTVIPLGWGNAVNGSILHNWGGRVDEDGTVHFPKD
jgi:hypothetical protein